MSLIQQVKLQLYWKQLFLKFLPGNTHIDVHEEMNEFGFGLNNFVIDNFQGGASILPTESFAYVSSSLLLKIS